MTGSADSALSAERLDVGMSVQSQCSEDLAQSTTVGERGCGRPR